MKATAVFALALASLAAEPGCGGSAPSCALEASETSEAP